MIYILLSITQIILSIFLSLMFYNYVNVREDPSIALPVFLIVVLMLSWGIFFFIFYGLEKFFIDKNLSSISSIAYKQSMLIGLFFFFNIGMLTINKWSYFLLLSSMGFVVVLEYLWTRYELRK